MSPTPKLSPNKILILAGEASGDALGAKLALDMQTQKSELQFYGMGARKMRAANIDILVDADQMSIVGVKIGRASCRERV